MKSAVLALVALLAVDVTVGRAQTRVEQLGADLLKGMVIPKENEIKIGEAISAQLCARYGVVQDAAIHKYVTLVGRALTAESSRPTELPWTFIVLDTWGVNAFAAPGGYVHITKGALALIKSESELAGVLAHEIMHVTERHTLAEIRRRTGTEIAAKQLSSEAFNQVVSEGFNLVKNNLWGQPEEQEADRLGVELASNVGYAPVGLSDFLAKLVKRNASRTGTERNGLFSTHPDVTARLGGIGDTIGKRRLMSTSVLAERYVMNVPSTTYQLQAPEEVASRIREEAGKVAPAGRAATAGLDRYATFVPGIQTMNPATASAAMARNVNVEADAPGGPNPKPVIVKLEKDDLSKFRQEIEG